jgi:hypothetical protein
MEVMPGRRLPAPSVVARTCIAPHAVIRGRQGPSTGELTWKEFRDFIARNVMGLAVGV